MRENPARASLEQVLYDPDVPASFDPPTNLLLASIAVSLKRIADTLDGTAMGLCVTETIFNPATVQNREVRNHY